MSGDLPKVPPQHEISRAAARWIEHLLPGAWVTHRPSEGDDYGVDLRIEIAESGTMTGRQVVVQVKGTADPTQVGRVKLRRATVNYLRELADPAVILRACPDTQGIRFVSAQDPRFDVDEDAWIRLDDGDAVAPGELPRFLNRLSHRSLVEAGRAPLVVGVDTDVAARRTSLAFQGKLDGLVVFEVHDDSPQQQYRSTYIEGAETFRLQSLLPPRQFIDVLLTASLTELITTHVSFLWRIGLGAVGARMLLRASSLLGNKLVNPQDLINSVASFLTAEECSTILRVCTANGNLWPAQWMTVLMKSGVQLHLTKDVVEHAFAIQEKDRAFPALLQV